MKEYNYIFDKVSRMLNPKRFEHSINVEKEAVKLGNIYNVDIYKCKIAGIVHDVVKNYSDGELICAANNYKLPVDEIQLHFPQLLHGPVAAFFCKYEFDIDDIDILNSIYYHTTGRKNMSMLEKIIYLADVTEQGRHFPEIEVIRNKSYENLNEALLLSCDSTLNYIIEKNFLIHPLTIEFRNSLLLEVGTYHG